MFEKIIESSTETVKKTIEKGTEPIWNRLKNPFIASFTISWFLWNWKAIVFFIFSKQIVEYKLLYISKTFYDWGIIWDYGWIPIILKCIIFPAGSAYLYIRCLPELDNHFDRKNESAYNIKNEKILKDEKAGIDRKAELDKQIAEKENEIFKIKNELSEGESVSSLKERINTLNDQLTNLLAENEKIVKDNIEQTVTLKSTFQEQIDQLEVSLNNQGNRLKAVTEEREKFRSELNGYQQGSVQIEMELHNLRDSLNFNKLFSARLIDSVISHSTFNQGVDHVRVVDMLSEIKDDEDYKLNLGNIIAKGRINNSIEYFVKVKHDEFKFDDNDIELNQIIGMLGGIKYTEQPYETIFTFASTRDLDKEMFKKVLTKFKAIKSVEISEVW